MAGHSDTHIAKRAYEIWEREGRPHGRDREHWLKAVEEISASIVADPVVLKPAKPRKVAGPKAVAAPKAEAPAAKLTKAMEAVTAAPRIKAASAKAVVARKK
jgi:hypothetical protein